MPGRVVLLVLGLLSAPLLHATGLPLAAAPCRQATQAEREAYLHGAMDVSPQVAQMLVHAIDGQLAEVRHGLRDLPAADQPRWRQAAMLTAVYAGRQAEASALLHDGADIDRTAWLPELRSALLEGARSPQLRSLAHLQHVAGEHAQASGPALVAAVSCGDAAMVGMLLGQGADARMQPAPNVVDLLTNATLQGNATIVTLLLDHGATSCRFDRHARLHGQARSLAALGKRAGLPDGLTARMRCPAT
jgi:hypothetical protein